VDKKSVYLWRELKNIFFLLNNVIVKFLIAITLVWKEKVCLSSKVKIRKKSNQKKEENSKIVFTLQFFFLIFFHYNSIKRIIYYSLGIPTK
jgi:hypothetical protein